MKVINTAGLAFFISTFLLSLLWIFNDFPLHVSTGFIGFIVGGVTFYIVCAQVNFFKKPSPDSLV